MAQLVTLAYVALSFFSPFFPQELRKKAQIFRLWGDRGFHLSVFRKFPELSACFLLYNSGADQEREATC